MSFLHSIVTTLDKPKLVFGSNGKQEYFAVSYEERLLGSMIHLHVRNVGEEERAIDKRPYHTYLVADAPDWTCELLRIREFKYKKTKKRK